MSHRAKKQFQFLFRNSSIFQSCLCYYLIRFMYNDSDNDSVSFIVTLGDIVFCCAACWTLLVMMYWSVSNNDNDSDSDSDSDKKKTKKKMNMKELQMAMGCGSCALALLIVCITITLIFIIVIITIITITITITIMMA